MSMTPAAVVKAFYDDPMTKTAQRGRPQTSAYTPKEMQLVHDYNALMEKFQWLREHPGSKRSDYQKALRDGSFIEWRKAAWREIQDEERSAWERDYPGIPYDDVTTCSAAYYPKEVALFQAWSRGRDSIGKARS
jgi:hypothetical protein